MTTEVLLAHSFYLRLDPKQVRKMKPYPPLGTLWAASVLRSEGRRIALFDAMLADGEAEFEAALARENPRVVGILEDNFNFLTKMCLSRMREAAFAMVAAARGKGCLVVANGSDCTDRLAEYLAAGVDYAIVGETERTLPELLAALDARRDPAGVPGLAFLRDGKLVRTAPRDIIRDLDSLPLPAWDLVDGERYRRAWTAAHGRFSLNLATSRGCPYVCNWCAKPNYGTRYGQRSVESVVEELVFLRDALRPDHVWFADDIFGLQASWMERFGDAAESAGVRTPFTMQSRTDLMRETAVEALSRAGAEEVWMGVESGEQRILDAMEKGTTVRNAVDATRRLRTHGIRAAWFLQLGYPGEEWADILATRDFVRRERPDDVGVSVSYPLPGTKFFDRVKGEMEAKTSWSDSDDLAMMFRGTFESEVYRESAALLHREAAEGERSRAVLDAAWRLLGERAAGARHESPSRLAPVADA